MWVAALIIAECIGVMPAKHLKHLAPVAQVHFGDATRTRLTIGDHCLSVGIAMQVVVCVGSARGRVISFGIGCTIRRTPAAKALCVIAQYAAVKTDSLAVAAPKFVFIPFISALPRNRLTL